MESVVVLFALVFCVHYSVKKDHWDCQKRMMRQQGEINSIDVTSSSQSSFEISFFVFKCEINTVSGYKFVGWAIFVVFIFSSLRIAYSLMFT